MGTEKKTMEAEEAAEQEEATNGTNATNAAETAKAAETTESIKTMKSIYIEKNNSMEYFIDRFKSDDFAEIDGNDSIAKSAFAHSDVEKVLIKGKGRPKNIGEKAFEGCKLLTTVIFDELEKDKQEKDDNQTDDKQTPTGNYETKIGKHTIKNVKLASVSGDYTIQANAFKDCTKLTTLVLPKVDIRHKLLIEKDAFSGCGALRTVVAICNKADFTGNPFADSPEHLTFICTENSGVARFARENGYRSVYVG